VQTIKTRSQRCAPISLRRAAAAESSTTKKADGEGMPDVVDRRNRQEGLTGGAREIRTLGPSRLILGEERGSEVDHVGLGRRCPFSGEGGPSVRIFFPPPASLSRRSLLLLPEQLRHAERGPGGEGSRSPDRLNLVRLVRLGSKDHGCRPRAHRSGKVAERPLAQRK
jgi:hypothetical protein